MWKLKESPSQQSDRESFRNLYRLRGTSFPLPHVFWMLKNISIELVMGWEGHEVIHDYLNFIRDTKDEVSKVITDIISIDEVPDTFEKLLKPNTEAKVMLVFD